jgi:hypothetical protein
MSLTLRPNEFTQPDFDVISREDDGHVRVVGRIYHAWPKLAAGYWFWSVNFFHRRGRSEPYQGRAATEAEAREAWRACWQSAKTPINSEP